MDLETLINDLQEANRKFQTALKDAEIAKAEANKQAAAARKIENSYHEKMHDLQNREAKIAAAESVEKQLEDAKRIKEENAALAIEIEKEKADLERRKKEFKGEYSSKMSELKKQAEENENSRKNFQDQNELLQKEKAEFKQKLKDLGIK